MEKKLKKIFNESKYESSLDLAGNIWQAIVLHEKRTVRLKLWAFSIIGLSSLVGLVPVFKTLLTDLARSGFYEYFSLLFSNGESIITYWKDFILSLAEALPIVSIISSLVLIFIFVLSIKYIIKQIIKGQLVLSISFNN